MFKDAAWFIPENQSMDSEIARFLAEIDPDKIAEKAAQTKHIIVTLKQQVLDAYLQIAKYA